MSATQRKDRLYGQLAASLQRLKQTTTQTTDLTEALQEDLGAMKTFAGIHAAQFMTVSTSDRTDSRQANDAANATSS